VKYSFPLFFRHARWLGLGLLMGAGLAGCIVAPRPYHPYRQPAVVVAAPPAPQTEVMVPAPGPNYFWVPGHWAWTGERHQWIRGHWEGQRAGYRWEQHNWVREGKGWREAPGHWAPQ
jgi:hypothetical protein